VAKGDGETVEVDWFNTQRRPPHPGYPVQRRLQTRRCAEPIRPQVFRLQPREWVVVYTSRVGWDMKEPYQRTYTWFGTHAEAMEFADKKARTER